MVGQAAVPAHQQVDHLLHRHQLTTTTTIMVGQAAPVLVQVLDQETTITTTTIMVGQAALVLALASEIITTTTTTERKELFNGSTTG